MMSAQVEEQVIGAVGYAAKDARVRAAATEMASNPRIQAAAYDAARAATADAASDAGGGGARDAPAGSGRGAGVSEEEQNGEAVPVALRDAAHRGVETMKAGFREVKNYVEENHYGLKAVSLCVALALFVCSIISLINVFSVLTQPYQYLFSIYNACFAAIILVIEGKSEWFARCGNLRAELFDSAKFLARQSGRAAFYVYVGSINLIMLPGNMVFKIIYIIIGCALCLVGAMTLCDRLGLFGRTPAHAVRAARAAPPAVAASAASQPAP
eukprot:TRINITY_DN26157_c0_g1_i1.p2 TRINITY_DN26157_c0_g1~~TRINITY_DN26157_c0_g1_i1.p2  ORF type:complete len:270 (+),score=69.21 TRINITY_DN26157_c0_g1_i1:71-880(+)